MPGMKKFKKLWIILIMILLIPATKKTAMTPIDLPRLKKNVTSNFPEQIALAISSPTSMWASWVTGDAQIGKNVTPFVPSTIGSEVWYGKTISKYIIKKTHNIALIRTRTGDYYLQVEIPWWLTSVPRLPQQPHDQISRPVAVRGTTLASSSNDELKY